jgi:4-hydroxythreonine-4-phosphate dehydrogenase
MKIKPIILVAGEPKSIFFEIFFKALKKNNYKSPLILVCCKKLLLRRMKEHKFKKKIKILEINELKKINLNNKFINVIDIRLKKSSNKKNQDEVIKKYINNLFNTAFQLIKDGFTKKFINGPINKKTFLNKKFLGVTEFISKNFEIKKTGMLIYNKKLSVCPVTTHLPIKLVSKKITKKLIEEKIEIVNLFFKKNFRYKAKIAVTGMNPHCETILKFNEDERIVSSAIKAKIKKGINVKGPFPADTIFLKKNRNKFDVILGMYHDQVLTPFKTLFEYEAINITMGLPFLRVSPDHGPNQNMLGRNKSNPQSIIKALEFLDNR